MGVYVNDQGTLRSIARLFVNDQGTLREIVSIHVNDQGTLRNIYMSQVFLPAAITIIRSASSPAGFQILAAGTFGPQAGSGGDSGTWLISGAASDYSVKFHPTSGSVSTGTIDSFLDLGTNRSWTRAAGVGQDNVVIGTLTIQRDSDSAVLATCTLSIECDNS